LFESGLYRFAPKFLEWRRGKRYSYLEKAQDDYYALLQYASRSDAISNGEVLHDKERFEEVNAAWKEASDVHAFAHHNVQPEVLYDYRSFSMVKFSFVTRRFYIGKGKDDALFVHNMDYKTRWPRRMSQYVTFRRGLSLEVANACIPLATDKLALLRKDQFVAVCSQVPDLQWQVNPPVEGGADVGLVMWVEKGIGSIYSPGIQVYMHGPFGLHGDVFIFNQVNIRMLTGEHPTNLFDEMFGDLGLGTHIKDFYAHSETLLLRWDVVGYKPNCKRGAYCKLVMEKVNIEDNRARMRMEANDYWNNLGMGGWKVFHAWVRWLSANYVVDPYTLEAFVTASRGECVGLPDLAVLKNADRNLVPLGQRYYSKPIYQVAMMLYRRLDEDIPGVMRLLTESPQLCHVLCISMLGIYPVDPIVSWAFAAHVIWYMENFDKFKHDFKESAEYPVDGMARRFLCLPDKYLTKLENKFSILNVRARLQATHVLPADVADDVVETHDPVGEDDNLVGVETNPGFDVQEIKTYNIQIEREGLMLPEGSIVSTVSEDGRTVIFKIVQDEKKSKKRRHRRGRRVMKEPVHPDEVLASLMLRMKQLEDRDYERERKWEKPDWEGDDRE